MNPMKEVTSMMTLMHILAMIVSLSTGQIQQLYIGRNTIIVVMAGWLAGGWYSLLSSFLMTLHHQVLLFSVILHSPGISNPSLIWPYDPLSILRELMTISAMARTWKRGEIFGEC